MMNLRSRRYLQSHSYEKTQFYINLNSESPCRTGLRLFMILNLRLNSKTRSSLKRSWPKWRRKIKRKASFKHSNIQTDRSRPVKRVKSSRKVPNSAPNSKRSKINKCEKVADQRWNNHHQLSRISNMFYFNAAFFHVKPLLFFLYGPLMSKCVDIASMSSFCPAFKITEE